MRDIFGQGFSDGLFGSVIGAIIGSITTLVFYYLGNKSEQNKNKKIKHDEEVNMLKYFSALMSSIILSAKERTIIYKIHTEVLIENPYQIYPLTLIPDADLSRALDKLEHKRIFHSYMSLFSHKDKVDEFKNIFIALDNIEHILIVTQQEQQQYFTENGNKIKQFNNLYERLIDTCITTIENFEKNRDLPQLNGLLTFLKKTLDKFYQDAENPIRIHYIIESLIKPIQVNVGGVFFNFEESKPILDQCREASLVLYDIVGYSQGTSDQFHQLHNHLVEAILVLELNTANLLNKFKPI